ncbi:MAG: hypothetical protein Q8N26_26455 [Myxococcales bacterium]|nr:hypothetical protein [Myxococcales bacterium]
MKRRRKAALPSAVPNASTEPRVKSASDFPGVQLTREVRAASPDDGALRLRPNNQYPGGSENSSVNLDRDATALHLDQPRLVVVEATAPHETQGAGRPQPNPPSRG